MLNSWLFSKSVSLYAFAGFSRSQPPRLMRTSHCAAIKATPAHIAPLVRVPKLDAQSLSHVSSHPNPVSSSWHMLLSESSSYINCDRNGMPDAKAGGSTLISSTVLMRDSVMVWTRRYIAIRTRRLCSMVSDIVLLWVLSGAVDHYTARKASRKAYI